MVLLLIMRFYFLLIGFFISIISLNAQSNKLFIPDTISGSRIKLQLKTGSHEFIPGKLSKTMGVNQDYLAPSIILRRGQKVDFLVENSIGDTTTIHWHGLHVAPKVDGGPHTYILNNSTWKPTFEVLDNPGTYWYHPHLHHKTNKHVQLGISGFILVNDTNEEKLPLPRTYGNDDIPLLIQTKGFDSDGEIEIETALDTTLLCNGTRKAYVEVGSHVVRFRLLNGASERVFNIGLSNSLSFYLIGTDGGLLDSSLLLNRLQLAPGERAEILVDLLEQKDKTIYLKNFGSELPNGIYGARQPGMGAGQTIPNYALNPLNGGDYNLLEIRVIQSSLSTSIVKIPQKLIAVQRLDRNVIDTNRTLVFMPMNMGPTAIQGPFMIDNAMFDMSKINHRVKLNNTEIWTLRNQTPIAHPFHIHHGNFEILDINGSVPPPYLSGKKDVVLVPAGNGVVRFVMKFETFYDDTIPYMYHCHMLTHEDHGMMGQFIIESPSNLYSNQLKNFNVINLYPNPVLSGVIHLKSSDNRELGLIELFDLSGKIIKKFNYGSIIGELDVSELTAGIYIVKQGQQTYKIIIE